MIRVFIAVVPPDEYKNALKLAIQDFSEIFPTEVKWVDPAGIHLTLKFLGNIPKREISTLTERISYAIDQFPHREFKLQLDRLSAFPNTSHPKILWAGLRGEMEKLQILQQAGESQISSAGFPADQRSFNPHITIGRTRRQTDSHKITAIGQKLRSISLTNCVDWIVSDIHIVESVLKPTGAVYTSLASQHM